MRIFLLGAVVACLYAQPTQVVIIPGSPPGGAGAACSDTAHGYLASTGIIYTCQSSVWTAQGGASATCGTPNCTVGGTLTVTGTATIGATVPAGTDKLYLGDAAPPPVSCCDGVSNIGSFLYGGGGLAQQNYFVASNTLPVIEQSFYLSKGTIATPLPLNNAGAFEQDVFGYEGGQYTYNGVYTVYPLNGGEAEFDWYGSGPNENEMQYFTISGNLTYPGLTISNGSQYLSAYSAAGTPLPTCGSAGWTAGTKTRVTDATVATPGSAYVSGGTFTISVQCIFNSSGSVYSWIID